MIVADKKVLEANLAKGTLSIQYKLNVLYRENLNSLATQSALIARIGLVGFQQGNDAIYDLPTTPVTIIASLILFLGLNIGTIASFLSYTQSTVEVIWGPIMGLSGDHHSEVIEATRHMLIQQNESMAWLSLAVSGILCTPFFFIFLTVDWKCAIPVGVAMIVGYYLIWTEGSKAYELFNYDAAWKGALLPSSSPHGRLQVWTMPCTKSTRRARASLQSTQRLPSLLLQLFSVDLSLPSLRKKRTVMFGSKNKLLESTRSGSTCCPSLTPLNSALWSLRHKELSGLSHFSSLM